MEHKTITRCFLGILAVFILLRLPLFWTPVIDMDEAIYSLFTKVWFSGGLPYIDCVETKPLGIYFIYGVIFELFGYYNMLAVHVFTVLWMFLTSIVLYLITKRFSGVRAGLIAALFYAVFTTTYTPKIIASVIEPIMLLPVALQMFFWMKYEEQERDIYAFLSGVAFSTAIVLKYTAGIYFVMMLIYIFAFQPKAKIKSFMLFCIGSVVLPMIMAAYLYKKDVFDAFMFWTVSGSFDYISGGAASIDITKQIITRALPFIAGTAILWIFTVARLKALYSSCHCERSEAIPMIQLRKKEWLIWLWLVMSFAPVIAGKRFYGHYFLMLVPPLSVLAALQMDKWWSVSKRTWLKYVAVGFIVLAGVGCLVPRFMMDKIYTKLGEDNPKDYAPVADYIKAHTENSDKIAVWGFAPLIYTRSERLPAFRFFWSDLMAGRVPAARQENGLAMQDSPGTKLAWKMFFEDIEKNKPVYFIDTAPAALHDYEHFPMSDYPELSRYVKDNFKTEAVVNGVVVYRRR